MKIITVFLLYNLAIIRTSKNKQVILKEYQPHKSILTESVKVKFAIKPAKTDSLSPTVVTEPLTLHVVIWECTAVIG